MSINILITGASNGIGRDLSILFAENHDCNIIAVSSNSQKLVELNKIVKSAGHTSKGRIIAVSLDLMNKDLTPVINEVKNLGRLDILINNAAILIKKELAEISEEEIRELFEINFFAPLRLIKALYKFMGGEEKSHIINISSMGGYQGTQKFPGMSVYSSSKAALANITESLAVELNKYNISVNCLALGSVQTEMLFKAFPNFKAPVTSIDIAKFIMDFATTGHNYFNGKILPVALTTP